MSTLKDQTITNTYHQLMKRQDTYSATASRVEIMDDSAVFKESALYIDITNQRLGIATGGAPVAALDVRGTVQVGVAGTGHDVTFYGDTSGKHILWDQDQMEFGLIGDGTKLSFYDIGGDEFISADNGGDLTIAAGAALNITANVIDLSDATKDITLNAAVDAMNFDSNTLSIDASNNRVGIGTAAPNATLEVKGSFSANASNGTFLTFSSSDTTPSVTGGNLFKTHASGQTLTTFDNGVVGQIITVISTAAVVFAVSGNLQAGSTAITTALGDVTQWVYDGTSWYLLSWLADSIDLSSGGF